VIGYTSKAFSKVELRYCTTCRVVSYNIHSEILPTFLARISVCIAYRPRGSDASDEDTSSCGTVRQVLGYLG